MRSINIVVEDREFDQILAIKKAEQSWRQFLLSRCGLDPEIKQTEPKDLNNSNTQRVYETNNEQ